VSDCALFSQHLPSATGSKLHFIDAQWQQQQADGSVKQLASGSEVC
jgi:hypothetical protein